MKYLFMYILYFTVKNNFNQQIIVGKKIFVGINAGFQTILVQGIFKRLIFS